MAARMSRQCLTVQLLEREALRGDDALEVNGWQIPEKQRGKSTPSRVRCVERVLRWAVARPSFSLHASSSLHADLCTGLLPLLRAQLPLLGCFIFDNA